MRNKQHFSKARPLCSSQFSYVQTTSLICSCFQTDFVPYVSLPFALCYSSPVVAWHHLCRLGANILSCYLLWKLESLGPSKFMTVQNLIPLCFPDLPTLMRNCSTAASILNYRESGKCCLLLLHYLSFCLFVLGFRNKCIVLHVYSN